MKRRILVFIQIALLLMMYVPAAIADSSIVLSLSASTASVGDTVTASGVTSPGAWVPLKVIDSAGNIVAFDAGRADTEGNYRIDFVVPEDASGVLMVVVGEGSNVTSEMLTIVTGISMSLSKTTASVGDTVTASGKTSPNAWVPIKVLDSMGNIVWFDSGRADTEGNYNIDFIVAEDASGVLTVVVGEGDNVISKTLTVVPKPVPVTGVRITEGDQTLEKGQTVQLNAIVEPEDATNKAVTWTSSEDSIATVSATGLVTGFSAGTATITVTTQDGNYTASINVRVTAPVAQPKASPSGGSVGVGTKVTLTTTTPGADIYYTLNKSTPNTNSNKYTKPIPIEEPVTIKAIAVKAGMDDSTMLSVSYSLAKAIEDTDVEVSESDKELAVTEDTLKLVASVKINVPEGVKDATVSVSALMNPPDESGIVTTGELPALSIAATDTAVSSAAPIKVSIPKGATITAPEGWNGTINVPTVKPLDSVKVDPDPGKKVTVNTVIEIGFGDVPLTFSKAVRLVIPGQAGKDAGYYRGGKSYKIPSLPSNAQDDQDWADQNIGDGKDGKMDVGQDLVIWTKHFTKFVSYTQTDTGGGSIGGGGGGFPTPKSVISKTGSATVTPGAGGTISLGDEAAIDIPANALTGTSAVEVKVAKVTAPPSVPTGFRFVGNVYEFRVGGKTSYTFSKKVTVTLTFDPGRLGQGEIPAVYYYDQAGKKWVKLAGEVKGSTVTVQADHFTMFAVLAEVKPADQSLRDIAGHWAEDNIKRLIVQGAIGGYPDGTFKPENRIARAEFATILVKAFKLEPQKGKVFADTADHWAQDSVGTAAHYGIVTGYDANTFGPNDNITREQMAVMVMKAAQLTPATNGLSFQDDTSISDWAREAVATAVGKGIIKGYPDNTFRPQGPATRAEAVTVVVNAL